MLLTKNIIPFDVDVCIVVNAGKSTKINMEIDKMWTKKKRALTTTTECY